MTYYLEKQDGVEEAFLCTDGGICDDLDYAEMFDTMEEAAAKVKTLDGEWNICEDISEGW